MAESVVQYLLFVVVTYLLTLTLGITGQQCTTNFGRSFTLAFPGQFQNRTDGELLLHVLSRGPGTATLQCQGTSPTTVTLASNNITTIAVNPDNHIHATTVSSNVCKLSASTEIAVSVLDTVSDIWLSVEGYLALPDKALSTDYVAMTYIGDSSGSNSSEIVVTCLSTCTVTFTLSTTQVYNGQTYLAGENLTVSLHKNAIQLANHGDLSGTFIHSDTPVGVYTANQCAKIPYSISGDCDFILEQMLPVQSWGRQYIVPWIPPRLSTRLRVYSPQNTSFTLYKSGGSSTQYSINTPTQFVEFELQSSKTPAVISSLTPVGVVQFGEGHAVDRKSGGPFMSIVPSLDQLVMNSTVGFEDTTSRYNYKTVVVTVLTSQISDLIFNGVQNSQQSSYNVPSPLSQYSVLYFSAPSTGKFVLSSKSGRARFAAMIYSASKDDKYSFGYPMIMGFPSQGICSPLTTTPHPMRLTPTIHPVSGGSRMCFSCNDVSHFKYCNSITTCKTGEVCYVSSYTTTEGNQRFRSGCVPETSCNAGKKRQTDPRERHLRAASSPCLSCCNTDFCNSQGCGETGFVARDQRGPLCLDCSHVGNPSECKQITLCRSNEVCSISEYRWGETERTFTLGCHDHLVCAVGNRRSVDVSDVHERSVPVCHGCCTGDFCNRNCTAGPGGSSLIG